MFILMFYTLIALFFVGFGLLFGLDTADFGSVWTYLIIIGDLLLSLVLGVISALGVLSLVGEMRKGKPYNDKFNHAFANSFLRFIIHIARIKISVTGLENIPKDNNFVYVGNHQENYDIPVLMPIFRNHPICFIAKEALFTVPVIGKWIGLLGNVPIGKMADREAAKSIITGIKRYKEGVPFGIFPEGRRSRSNEMIEFKPGAFKLAMKPKANLLVGTIYDMGKVFTRFPWKRYHVYVHFHPVINYEDYKDLNTQQLSAQVKGIIQKKLDEYKESLS